VDAARDEPIPLAACLARGIRAAMSDHRVTSGPGEPDHLALRPGDLVEVKSVSEIRKTLDERGELASMPFMAEMLQYCGRRFVVSKRAEKICDTVNYTGSRRLPDTVLLDDLRCDGSGHGGCQAECRLFWKEQWLRRVQPGVTSADTPQQDGDAGALAEQLSRNTKSSQQGGAKMVDIYHCQATAVPAASEHLRVWDPRTYVREYTSGNVDFGHFLRVTARAACEEPLRKLHVLPSVWLAGPGEPDTEEPLGLQAGDWVRVKSKEEIARSLDATGKSRGLWFDREMLPHCGGTYRVRRRIDHFIDDRNGRMVRIKHCVTLEGVMCTGDLSPRRWLCPRAVYPYWRERWLSRTSAPA
jgi:hypothetical protein